MDYRKEAYYMVKKGLVPLPLNSEKRPLQAWEKWQKRFPTKQEINLYFKNCGGVGAVTYPQNKETEEVISDLFLLDFDLKYQLPHQDFFGEFMSKIPKEISKKFVVNTTRSRVGRHIWLRSSEFFDKSRKIAYRYKTVDEMKELEERLRSEGVPEKDIMRRVLAKPYSVIIESRGKNSFGVLLHPEYKRLYGKQINHFSADEMEIIMNAAYSCSEFYEKREQYTGDPKDFNVIEKFNQDHDAHDVMNMLSSTGMLKEVGTNYRGDILFLRHGSSASHSGIIFKDTAIVNLYSHNTILGDIKALNPFQVFCQINQCDTRGAVKLIRNQQKQK